MSDHYILVGQTPVPVEPCDPYTPEGIEGLVTWGLWFEDGRNRIVCSQVVMGMCWVSTVFLGLDHSFRGPVPILFETMAFWPGDGGNEQDRCATWLEAEAMHCRMVAEVASPRAVWGYVVRTLRAALQEARDDWREGWRELLGKGPKRYANPLLNEGLDCLDRLKKLESEREDTDWMRFG